MPTHMPILGFIRFISWKTLISFLVKWLLPVECLGGVCFEVCVCVCERERETGLTLS